jgi:hypothetical protein
MACVNCAHCCMIEETIGDLAHKIEFVCEFENRPIARLDNACIWKPSRCKLVKEGTPYKVIKGGKE